MTFNRSAESTAGQGCYFCGEVAKKIDQEHPLFVHHKGRQRQVCQHCHDNHWWRKYRGES